MKTQLGRSLIVLLSCGLLASGCHTGTRTATENKIQFDSVRVDRTYHFLDNPENPNCNLQISFTYPSGYAHKERLKKLQRQFVTTFFGENYEHLAPEKAVEQYTADYLAAYKELEKDFEDEIKKTPDAPVASWYSYYEMSEDDIVFNQDDLLSYTVTVENYTGGAHGAHSHTNQVLDLKTGDPLTEEDIFVENFQEGLARILVDAIARQNGVDEPKELENMGFFSIEEIFPNGNFLVDDTGVTYTFNEYEIAAYVVGAVNVHLPYEEIGHLLKKDSPIAHLTGQ